MSTAESQRILKANAIRNLGSKVAYQFGDLEQKGSDYLSQVQQQAQQILAEAQTQAEQIRKSAQDQGYQAGLKAGTQQAEQQITERSQTLAEQALQSKVETVLPALAKVADALKVEKQEWINTWENLVIQLAARIAEKLTRHQIETQPELANELIASTLEIVAGNTHIKVRLNQDDYESLGPDREEVLRILSNCAQVEVESDNSLAPGDSIVHTQHGTIDARIETFIDRIVSELTSGEV